MPRCLEPLLFHAANPARKIAASELALARHSLGDGGSGERRLGWSRREFLGATLLLAAMRGARATGATSSAPPEGGWIDVHCHVQSGDTVRWPRLPIPPGTPEGPHDFPPETLLAHAHSCGVKRVVLIQRGFYGFDDRYMLSVMARFPGVFSGVARVDHHAPTVVAEGRRLAALGVRGFRIQPANEPKTWLDAGGMDALWSFAAERRMAICPLIDPDALPGIERMCRRHPATTVAIDHLCRIGASGEIRESDVRALCALAARDQVMVKVSGFHALGAKRPPYLDLIPLIRRVYDAYGPQRLMWGTDSPFSVIDGNTYEANFALVHNHLDFLSDQDRNLIMRGNAERIFFL